MISLTLPFPPTANTVWRNVNGRTLISKRGRQFRADVSRMVAEQIKYTGIEASSDRLCVEVLLYPPDKRRRDIDNYNKALLDAITHTGRVWQDDSQIDTLNIQRRGTAKGGYCIVNIYKIRKEAA